MPEFCTCGAQLPDDARFCHKCGKPQRDEPVLEVETEVPVEPIIVTPVAPVPPPPINLRNGMAVRSALLACGATILLAVILGPLGLNIIAMIVGGFIAVLFYRKRTGLPLTVWSGMRLGWISGIFAFVLTVIAVTLMVVSLSQPDIAAQFREQMLKNAYPADKVTELFDMLRSPAKIGLMLLDAFISSTLLMGLGAAAGAKLLSRR